MYILLNIRLFFISKHMLFTKLYGGCDITFQPNFNNNTFQEIADDNA